MTKLAAIILSFLRASWIFAVSCFRFFVPMQKKSLAQEIVLITGAGAGIGRLMSTNFAKQGSVVVLWDINKQWMDETAEIITTQGGKAHSYQCDVTSKDEVYRLAKQVKKDVGGVTVLVNNAGVVNGKRFLDISDEMIERTMNVNAMGICWTLKAFLPSMIAQQHGHIVTIASIMGSCSAPQLSDYCASKHAAVALHESVSMELIMDNIKGVNMTLVQPYHIDTELFAGVNVGILPPLAPQFVADRVLLAVQTNQKVLCLPRLMYWVPFLLSILPLDCVIEIAQGLGFFTAMQSFIGRQKKKT
ncbi:epidermal retinol dehydrogenase 2-like [Saccoglossus kowalevskii]|uniref:Epidermal retinol dehydrogenase 2-like n=1 Tax=Saccoglossus kowalevskii TaxID=10224 RepID=A0ABM0H187_SACKO|nr:PREDICTED: epidermal retinol dehydrogenase 2-like [Saccoglossus kowalevskii]